jgi:hypothetical protein
LGKTLAKITANPVPLADDNANTNAEDRLVISISLFQEGL